MIISFKARVPKVTEDDILFNTSFDPLKDSWVWREKGIRAGDIIEIVAISKELCYVSHFDYFDIEAGYRKTVIRETFNEAMLKWEIALTSNAVFEDIEQEENEQKDIPDKDSNEEEDD